MTEVAHNKAAAVVDDFAQRRDAVRDFWPGIGAKSWALRGHRCQPVRSLLKLDALHELHIAKPVQPRIQGDLGKSSSLSIPRNPFSKRPCTLGRVYEKK